MDILSQIKLLFGPLVIQLVWYIPNLFSISLSSPKFWKILSFSLHSLLVKISRRRLSNRHGWVGRGLRVVGRGPEILHVYTRHVYIFLCCFKCRLLTARLCNRRGWVGRGSWVVSHGSWARDPPFVYKSCIHIFMLFQMPTPNSGFVCDLFYVSI